MQVDVGWFKLYPDCSLHHLSLVGAGLQALLHAVAGSSKSHLTCRWERQGSNTVRIQKIMPSFHVLVLSLHEGVNRGILSLLYMIKSKKSDLCAKLGEIRAFQAVFFTSAPLTNSSCLELAQAAARSDSRCQTPDLQQLPVLLVQFLFSNLACT